MSDRRLYEWIQSAEPELLEAWMREQTAAVDRRRDLLSEDELRRQSREFLSEFCRAIREGVDEDVNAPSREGLRAYIASLSRARARQGFSPSETAVFVLSLKQPLFALLQKKLSGDVSAFARDFWSVSSLLDRLGLLATECFIKSREEIISRQQAEMLELSTPVVRLWDGILALPVIGTLDSARTQVVMESLLQRIVDTASSIAIIDITGVPTVDTLVAQHLIKTVSAARLMGAECVISGIRPAIAQAMVHLGVSFNDVVTKATLADAIRFAFSRIGIRIVRDDAKD